jgi:hypothetical protein
MVEHLLKQIFEARDVTLVRCALELQSDYVTLDGGRKVRFQRTRECAAVG